MSVIFSEDFDTPKAGTNSELPVGWNLTASGGSPSIGLVLGGCGFGDGTENTAVLNKRFISCQNGQATHTYTGTATISMRAIVAFKASSSSQKWEGFYLWAPTGPLPGFVFIPTFYGNGKLSIRVNQVQSETLSPSATGKFPTDGTPFAVQWRMQINSSTSVDVAVDIDNVTAWTHTYTSTDNVLGTNQWLSGAGALFNAITILPIFGTGYNTAVDTLRIDNSNASTTWSVCADFEQLGTTSPQATISAFSITIAGTAFSITAADMRYEDYVFGTNPVGKLPPTLVIKGPDGTLYYEGAGIVSPVTYGNTTITGDMSATVAAGTWCALVGDNVLCWESSGASPEYFCTSNASLFVTKITIPAATTSFTVHVVSGVSPDTFELANGESRTYAVVAPATYAVSEDNETGYSTMITASNGSPANAVVINPGDSITVTITNTAYTSTNYPMRRERIFVLP